MSKLISFSKSPHTGRWALPERRTGSVPIECPERLVRKFQRYRPRYFYGSEYVSADFKNVTWWRDTNEWAAFYTVKWWYNGRKENYVDKFVIAFRKGKMVELRQFTADGYMMQGIWS